MLPQLEIVVLLAQFLHLAIYGIELTIFVAILFGQKRFLFG